MPRFPVPTEARLEALLGEAFEFMPGPDMARIAEIESRLLRAAPRPARPRRAALPWWAILLLAGGAATAAWWAGERLSGQHALRETPVTESNRARAEAPADEPRQAAPAANEAGNRVIYERETP